MKKWAVALLCIPMLFLFFAGCAQKSYQDGIYTAEMGTFDDYGYKEYIVVTVQGGAVTGIVFDAKDDNGALRSENNAYRDDMVEAMGTEPAQYASALVNQYLVEQRISQVDAVAGATLSSGHFGALFKVLEPQMEKGNTETAVVAVS